MWDKVVPVACGATYPTNKSDDEEDDADDDVESNEGGTMGGGGVPPPDTWLGTFCKLWRPEIWVPVSPSWDTKLSISGTIGTGLESVLAPWKTVTIETNGTEIGVLFAELSLDIGDDVQVGGSGGNIGTAKLVANETPDVVFSLEESELLLDSSLELGFWLV